MEVSLREHAKVIEQILQKELQSNTQDLDTQYRNMLDIFTNVIVMKKDHANTTCEDTVSKITDALGQPKPSVATDDIVKDLRDFIEILQPGMHVSSQQIKPKLKDNMAFLFQNFNVPYFNKHDYTYYTIIGTLLFAIAYHKITLDTLKGDSANCLFFKAPVTTKDGIDRELFVKVLEYPIPPNTDNIIVDNINGFILNHLVSSHSNPAFQPNKHFMEYIDSFVSFTSRSGRFTNNKYWKVDEFVDIMNRNCPMTIMYSKNVYREHPTLDLAHISIFKAINGYSMDKIFHDAIRWHRKHPSISPLSYDHIVFVKKQLFYISKLNEFMACMEYFGTDHGMIHNDLHQGNFFYDIDTESFRMIDLGRVHFGGNMDAFVDKDLLTSFICRETRRNAAFDVIRMITMYDYNNVMNVIHTWGKNNRDSSFRLPNGKMIYVGWLGDLLTFAGNMYHFMNVAKIPQSEVIHDIISKYLCQIDNMDAERKYWTFTASFLLDSTATNTTYLDVLISRYCTCKTEIQNALKIFDPITTEEYSTIWGYILDGILCLCMTMIPTIPQQQIKTQFTFNHLSRILYKYFQVYEPGLKQLMAQVKLLNSSHHMQILEVQYPSPIQRMCSMLTGQSAGFSRKKRSVMKGGEGISSSILGLDKTIDYFTSDYERIIKMNANEDTCMSPGRIHREAKNVNVKDKEQIIRSRPETRIPNPYESITTLEYDDCNNVKQLLDRFSADYNKHFGDDGMASSYRTITNTIDDMKQVLANAPSTVQGYDDIRKDISMISNHLASLQVASTPVNILKCKITMMLKDIEFILQYKYFKANVQSPPSSSATDDPRFASTAPIIDRQSNVHNPMVKVSTGGGRGSKSRKDQYTPSHTQKKEKKKA